MNEYGWAQNRAKLERAINELKETNQEITEESVKKIYRRLKGFVVGEDNARPFSKELEGLTSEQLFKLANEKAKLEGKKEEKAEPKKSTKKNG